MAVVIRNGRVLVQERFRQGRGMVFEFPGGSICQGETGKQSAVRELWEETGINDLTWVGSHKAQNDFGSPIYFVIFAAPEGVVPKVVDPIRCQIFHWMKRCDIPRKDFFKADIEFIETHLASYV